MRVLFQILPMLLVFMLPVQASAEDFAVGAGEAKAGDQIPHELSLKDQSGEVRDFESYTGDKGTVYIFVRSADWCPYCQVQMLDLRGEDGKKITDLGFNIVTVSYDAPEALKTFSEKYNFEHVMLSDEGSAAIKAFGILNEKYEPEHFAYGVPHPRVYIVGNDKMIHAVLAEEGYKKRPQVDAIVETIKGLEP